MEVATHLLGLTAVGEVVDRDQADRLSAGIEGLFRQEVAALYAGWPPGSTTDGTSVDICMRTGPSLLEVAGITFIDFDGSVFPFRATIEVLDDGSCSVRLFIGEDGLDTGSPPRFPSGALVVPVDAPDGLVVELIVGRRQVSIVWTQVLAFP